MKTKLGASLIAALMMMGLFGVSQATADPGPNGSNEKGLCTAYFNGQKKGHEKNGNPGPFQALEDAGQSYDDQNGADDGDDETNNDGEDLAGEQAAYSDVFEFCDQYGIMGQPEHNGRYDCKEPGATDGRDQDTDEEVECYPNTGETGEDGDFIFDTGGDHPSGKDDK